MIRQKQNFLSANWIASADSIRNVFRLIGSSFVWLGKLGERTGQLWHIFCAESGASIRLTVWKWSCESRYPGALPPALENFRRAFSPGPTDSPWVSEDG